MTNKTGYSIKRGEWQEETVKEQNGDPRYLDILVRLDERRSKILGSDAAEKVDHSLRVDVNMEIASQVRQQVLENVSYHEDCRASAIDSDASDVCTPRIGRPPKDTGQVEIGPASSGD